MDIDTASYGYAASLIRQGSRPDPSALDAKVQVTLDPQAVAAYRLIGYDDRALADSAFRDDRVDGGEVFAGHSVTALYTVRLKASADGTVAQVHTRWQDPDTHNTQETGAIVSVSDLTGDFAERRPGFRPATPPLISPNTYARAPTPTRQG